MQKLLPGDAAASDSWHLDFEQKWAPVGLPLRKHAWRKLGQPDGDQAVQQTAMRMFEKYVELEASEFAKVAWKVLNNEIANEIRRRIQAQRVTDRLQGVGDQGMKDTTAEARSELSTVNNALQHPGFPPRQKEAIEKEVEMEAGPSAPIESPRSPDEASANAARLYRARKRLEMELDETKR